MKHRLALPDATDLDVFDSGNPEVDDYFKSRRWFDPEKGKAAPPTYQFVGPDEEIVGYAAASFRKCAHPTDAVDGKAKYLVVYAAGLHRRFHGQEDPDMPGETFATSVFRVLEEFARTKDGCVGLYLWVRSDNDRAIAFYEKFGFERDPGGAVERDEGSPHLTMRKPLQVARSE